MADNNTIFDNVYNVTKNGNSYTVGTLSSSNASVTDTVTKSGESLDVLGDISNDGFTYNGVQYTYIGKTGDGAYVASTGSGQTLAYRLFSDSPVDQNTTLTADSSTTTGTTVICFLPGTKIATPDGEVAVESMRAGDLVKTSEGRVVPVRWIGRQTISTRFADPLRVLPICIKAGALAENVPSRDLYISPCHAVLIDDILVHAGALVNDTSIGTA